MKIYGLFETSAIDIASGIHPYPETLICAFQNEDDAISAMKENKKHYCDISAYEEYWAIYFPNDKNICKLFIKEIEVK